MLGDEMGLGKSVEALAAMCHLHVEGRRHFLVVCPASVLVNWTHEIRRHSELRSYRLHGPDRQRNFQAWTAPAASPSPPTTRCAHCPSPRE